MSGAYYNEIDPFAAQWLRELIKENLIAPGEVDERSIEEVKPEDLRGFTQCHFFAGIGVWSYALRNAGWGDDESIWTGSCPCPPFSSAGTKKACPQCQGTHPVPHVGRTGFFVCCLCDHEWFADARHLWPELWRLVSVCRPVALFGEQVAGDDGKTWLALVRASLEILGYAVGAKDLCSAGFGSSDIRQRLYFVADTNRNGAIRPRAKEQITNAGRAISVVEYAAIDGRARRASEAGAEPEREPPRETEQRSSDAGDMAHAGNAKRRTRAGGRNDDHAEETGRDESAGRIGERSTLGDLGNPSVQGLEGHGRLGEKQDSKERQGTHGHSAAPSSDGKLAHADSVESGYRELQRGGRLLQPSENPLAGFWRAAEWIYCRDEKYRPVEPGTFPLVNGTPNRVGRLRGYGNAINAEVAKAFIEAYMSI